MKKTNYKSKVPYFKFSDQIDIQINELKNNKLLNRMKKCRTSLNNDLYRPIFHYVNPEGNLNDPNGLCYWKDRWHLFYQAFPPEDPRLHWGHAVSDDLIHWEDLPYAIYPNPEQGCWSGSTLVDNNKVIAMYHGNKLGNMIAISEDPLLLNWIKLKDNPVIPIPKHIEQSEYTVFDPCIWKKDGFYYSLSAGSQSTQPSGKFFAADYLFRSKNLHDWEYLHQFIENDRYTLNGDDGACPYFWPIGNKHMLLFYSHMSGGQYLIGDYDKKEDKFFPTQHGLANFGASTPCGVHAPSACPDGRGSINIIFNMNPGKPTNGWNQIMTLPRKLTLDNKNKILIAPLDDIVSLRKNHIKINKTKLKANNEYAFDKIHSNTIEMILKIDLLNSSMIDINVLRSRSKKEFTRISFYKKMGFNDRFRKNYKNFNVASPPLVGKNTIKFDSIISIDSSFSSSLADVKLRPPETAPVYLSDEEILELRIFIDRSVVEVFVSNKQALALRVYPGFDDSKGLSIISHGNDSNLLSLDAWEMDNIYE